MMAYDEFRGFAALLEAAYVGICLHMMTSVGLLEAAYVGICLHVMT